MVGKGHTDRCYVREDVKSVKESITVTSRKRAQVEESEYRILIILCEKYYRIGGVVGLKWEEIQKCVS